MLHRAFSDLTIRSVDEEKRILRGVATSPRVDRVLDIIEPFGCTFRNPVVLLLQHSHDRPVGTVVFDKPTKDGVTFTAHIPKVTEPGVLKDRTDEAWQSVRAKILRHVSIGFRPIGEDSVERLPSGGLRYRAIEIFELSLVSVAAQPDAEILEVRANQARSSAVQLDAPKPNRDRVVRLSGLTRAVATGALKINTAPRNQPGEPFRVRKIHVTRDVVVRLRPDECPWLNRTKEPAPVVKLQPRDYERARHRVVKLDRRK